MIVFIPLGDSNDKKLINQRIRNGGKAERGSYIRLKLYNFFRKIKQILLSGNEYFAFRFYFRFFDKK